jgi:DNA modification methylase
MTQHKTVKLTDFTPDPNNANKGTQRGRGLLENSLQKLGAGRSVLADKNGVLIAGNKTLQTAVESGFENAIVVETDGTQLVVVKRTDLDLSTDAKAKELAVADNRIGEISLEWDAEVLSALSEEFDLSSMFFEEELEDLWKEWASPDQGLPLSPEEEEENASDLIEKADSGKIESRVKLGDIWSCGRHRIACGDSTDEGNVRKLLGGATPAFTWSDPPYGISYQSNSRAKSDKFAVIANDDQTFSAYIPPVAKLTSGWVIVCTAWKVLENWLKDTKSLGDMKNLIVWDKGGGGLGDLTHSLSTDYELMLAFNRGETIKGKRIGSVWGIGKDNPNAYLHPTQKPVELLLQAYESFTEPDDIIFDPFLGSAPSIIAAQQMEGNRTVLGFELSESYCEVILQRFTSLTGVIPELVGHL